MTADPTSIDCDPPAPRQTLSELLGRQLVEREALRRMTPKQRLRCAQRGELSAHQISVWCAHYPHEVPKVNDIPIWIAATLCDIVD